jgi:hypothetical protein
VPPHRPAEPIFAILKNYFRQFVFLQSVYQSGGCYTLRVVHSHIQRAFFQEAEASCRIVYLHRRYAEVGQYATIDGSDTTLGHFGFYVSVISVNKAGLRA